jgi:hypothetical protein
MNTLADADLDQVRGGMTCETATAVAAVYASVAAIYLIARDAPAAAGAAGKGLGVLEGACGL